MSARRASVEAVSRFDEQPVREDMSVAQRLSPVNPSVPLALNGVAQLDSALTELFEANDPALLNFQKNFFERSKAIESPESHSAFGLTGVLEDLLLTKPSDKYYYRQLGITSVQADSQFIDNIRKAFVEIATERSYVLADLFHYIAMKEIRLADFLKAVFRYYDEHEQTFLL